MTIQGIIKETLRYGIPVDFANGEKEPRPSLIVILFFWKSF